MYDELGRNIRYLRLSVTDRCNCRCLYCMPAHGISMLRHEDILSFEEMRAIVEASAQLGVRKVRLTGGEPLARRGIVDLVRMVSAVDGIEEVVMTTNLHLLQKISKQQGFLVSIFLLIHLILNCIQSSVVREHLMMRWLVLRQQEKQGLSIQSSIPYF